MAKNNINNGSGETSNAFNSENRTDDAFNSTKELIENDFTSTNELNEYRKIEEFNSNKSENKDKDKDLNSANEPCIRKISNLEIYDVRKFN